jgi:nitroreductase
MLDEERWTQVVEHAVRAPSIHNTQPWLFTARGDRLDVRRDPARAVAAVDPTGRQQVVSCGIAAEFAAVALAGLGYDAAVEVLPDPGDPELLATVRVTGAREVTPGDTALAEAIAARHTDRSPFRAEPLPAGLLDRIESEIGRGGIWLKPITEAEEEATIAVLLDQAEQLEQRDPAYLAELRAWTRTDPAATDGVPVTAVPDDRAARATNFVVRDFTSGDPRAAPAAAPTPADDDPPPAVERPAVVLLGTATDDRAAWVRAGIALGRLLLRITEAGLAASPLTQVLDQSWARSRLIQRLDLIGAPQMLLRLGRPTGPAVASGRRPVTEVLQLG